MKRLFCILMAAFCLVLVFSGCAGSETTPVRIGVSFGVGAAARWVNEQAYMEARAKELGVDIEVRLNKTDEPKTQTEDCIEMIDSGIDVLILTPRDANNVTEILEYAKQKKVPVVSYARVVLGQKVDLFVGYDSSRIGQKMGQYLVEKVYKGDYILLRGDKGDNNATLLHEGAMQYITPLIGDINVVLDAEVPGWSADAAKDLVREAITQNGNKIDAILAPNDTLAGACREVLDELGITTPVSITGMDADLKAVQRIVNDQQDMTIYMDLKELASTAIDEAVHLALGEKVNVNTAFDNQSDGTIDANLITGQLVTKENLDRILIDSGYFTREEVYGR